MSPTPPIAANRHDRYPRHNRRAGSAARSPGTALFAAVILAGICCWLDPLLGTARAADAASSWSADEVAGTVLVRAADADAGNWQPLSEAMPIAANSEVATGSDGKALLANGVDRIRLAPNSRITLPADESGMLTLIRQHFGRVLFDVAPRGGAGFEVDAPYLVVLVKGTRFGVQANYIESSVSVEEGIVEARPAKDGEDEGTEVGAGQTAGVTGPNGTLTVTLSGPSDSGYPESSDGGPEEKPKVTVAPPTEPEPEPEP